MTPRACAVALALAAAGCTPGPIAPPGPALSGPEIDLAAALPEAVVTPPEKLVERTVVDAGVGSGEVPAVFCHPPGSATWKIAVAPHARFETTLVRPRDLVEKGSDGVAFRIRVRLERAGEITLLDRFAAPSDPDRTFVSLDLGAWAGETITLTLATGEGPRGDGRYDGAFFASPRVRQDGAGSPAAPRTLLITIDTLRQDRLSCDGSPSVLTPAIDRLSRSGRTFASVLAQCNATTPSHAVLLTGKSPLETGVYQSDTPLPNGVETLAQVMRAEGRRTGAVISVAHLKPEMSGLGGGFEEFHACKTERRAASTTDVAMGFASRHRAEPLFLWLHYFDPHTSYVPPEPWIALAPAPSSPGTPIPSRADAEPDAIFPDPCRTWLAHVSDPAVVSGWYDGEVAATSHELGRLLRALAAWDMLASSAILLTADHGESLGEHGVYYGHAGLFEPEVRVPMILVGPGIAPAVVARPVAHLDVFPTLAHRTAGPAIPLGGDGPEDRTLASVHAHRESVMVTRGGLKVIVPWRPFFAKNKATYRADLARDPAETASMAGTPETAALESEARALAAAARCPAAIPVSQEEVDRLKSLGYVAPDPSRNGCD